MNIAITGSTGLIGTEVTRYFRRQGHQVLRISRAPVQNPDGQDCLVWDNQNNKVDRTKLEGQDAVIHLAGANIAGQRWSAAYKDEILRSRVNGTKLLAQTLAQLTQPPKIFLCASAVGYYGIHPADVTLDEQCPSGHDFLAQVCAQWEQAAQPLMAAGIRTVFMRFGVVLSQKGGALAKMRLPFKMGLGGPVGSGTQMMSWIALEEIPEIIEYLIRHDRIAGAVNCVAPQPVSNKEFAQCLGKVLHRPAIAPLPGFMVKLLFGEMGETLLLGGQKVIPQKLMDSGYTFTYASLEEALRV